MTSGRTKLHVSVMKITITVQIGGKKAQKVEHIHDTTTSARQPGGKNS